MSSQTFGTTISAACDGVAALRSAAKSASVKSVSCPIAVTTGISEEAISAVGTISEFPKKQKLPSGLYRIFRRS